MGETLRDGRFALLGLLGQGSQGETFDGVDRREGRAVAVKRFDVSGAKSWKDVELAEREASVLQSLSHPKLPGYIDHFESDGALYLVMEKIEGESLAKLHARGVALGEKDIIQFLTDASDVLDYLRVRAPPVIHRDLKPGNVIRRPDGSFAFVDFGAVRDKLRPRGGSTVVGTFGYMAPEQFQGRALPASDVYAIGATAVAMLTGREPEDLPHRGLAVDVRSALRGLVKAPLIRVLEHMLAPDPEERAGRIAPLLAQLEPGRGRRMAEGLPGGDDPWERIGGKHWEHLVRAEQRKAERRARHEAHRHARRAMRAEWRRAAHPIPRPVAFALALCFAIAALAVTAATQLIVPLTLRILSLFVARRALGNAATDVRNAGRSALESMAHGQRLLLAERAPASAPAAADVSSETSRDQVRVAAHSPTSHASVNDGAPPETVPIADDLERGSSAVKR
jgi:hypothetical protein